MSKGIELADAIRAGDTARQAELLRAEGVDRAAVVDTTDGRGRRLVTVVYGVDPAALR